MPDEAAVLDAPETGLEETSIDTTETQVETPEAHPITSEPGKPGAIETPPIKDGKFSPEIKQTLDKLKAENPAVERQIRNALFKADQISKALPGGLKELNAMRQLVEQRGGETGLQQMSDTLAGFQEFDQLYAAGDPKALDFMTSDPEGQQAFMKLMPVALQKFEKLSPDGYSGYMAGVFASDMAGQQIPLTLMRLQDLVADNPKALEQIQKVVEYYNRITGMAGKKVEAPAPAREPDNRQGEIEQREAKLLRNEWRAETASEQTQTFNSTWTELAAGRKLTANQDAAIRELFESKLGRAVQSKHADKLQRYFDAKDKPGFLRYASEITRTEVPTALRAAFDAVMPGRPGPRPGATPANKSTPVSDAAKGFTQIGQAPPTAEIDLKNPFNTPANYQKGLAVLKGNKKVQWKR